jgi:hypothetical protein
MPRGGARPNAGRKPKSERFERGIKATESAVAARLKPLREALLQLALDGGERREKRYEAACLILRTELDEILDRDGNPTGKMRRSVVPVFPGADPERIVLVEERVTTEPPDLRAIEYCIDRILGKPAAEPAPETEDQRLAALRTALVQVLETTDPEVSARVAQAIDDLLRARSPGSEPGALPPGE